MLYKCYELLRPDVVLELAWKNKIQDFAMPYFIQILREYSGRIERLEKAELERKEELKEQQQRNGPLMESQLMLTGVPHVAYPTGIAPQFSGVRGPIPGFGNSAFNQ